MTYVFGQSKPARRHVSVEVLAAESERVRQEIIIYERLRRQQEMLKAAQAAVHRSLPKTSDAERIRQQAIQQYGYTPEQCAQRLREATADMSRWKDPRSKR